MSTKPDFDSSIICLNDAKLPLRRGFGYLCLAYIAGSSIKWLLMSMTAGARAMSESGSILLWISWAIATVAAIWALTGPAWTHILDVEGRQLESSVNMLSGIKTLHTPFDEITRVAVETEYQKNQGSYGPSTVMISRLVAYRSTGTSLILRTASRTLLAEPDTVGYYRFPDAGLLRLRDKIRNVVGLSDAGEEPEDEPLHPT